MNARVAVAVIAAALTLGLSGCAGEPAEAGPPTAPASTVDRALHAALPAAVRDRGTLVVGTDPSYAPMSSFGSDGRTIVGMEPDLAVALGQVLGVDVEMREVPFDQIAARVGDGTIDLALTAMTDTAERAQKVDFVDYFIAGTAILVQRGNPDDVGSIADLCGKVVGVEQATVQVDLLEHQQGKCGDDPVRVETFTTNSDALLRLRTGRVTAVLNDLPPAALLTKDRRTRGFYELATRTQYEPGYYGMVVRRGDLEMRRATVGALRRLITGGQYTEVLDRWGLEAGAVDEVLVNSGR